MNMEIRCIRQQFAAVCRRLEGSVNISLCNTSDIIRETEAIQQPVSFIMQDPNGVSNAIEQIQKICYMFDRKLQFHVNTDRNQVIVKVIDSNTEKVIREIPSEEIQKLQMRIKETAGLLFDKTI